MKMSDENTLIKRLEEYEIAALTRENEFKEYLMQQFVALRKDMFSSIVDIKIRYDDHNKKHFVDDQRAETDRLQRAHRQFTLNLILAGIAALVIIGFVILGAIIILRL